MFHESREACPTLRISSLYDRDRPSAVYLGGKEIPCETDRIPPLFIMSAPVHSQARSLYRRLLRELPARTPSILANPSPLQKHIRADFANHPQTDSPSLQHQAQKPVEKRVEEAEQYVQYLAAQRMYTTLVERYNPGMNMSEEERVRLTARRVGMDLPDDMWRNPNGGKA